MCERNPIAHLPSEVFTPATIYYEISLKDLFLFSLILVMVTSHLTGIPSEPQLSDKIRQVSVLGLRYLEVTYVYPFSAFHYHAVICLKQRSKTYLCDVRSTLTQIYTNQNT